MMTLYITPPRNASRANSPSNPNRRHRADFARQAVIAAFGRHAWALDQADFVDRHPGNKPRVGPQ